MRKNVFGRQFKRDRNERRALFKSLLSSLVLHDRIKTSEAKAKAVKADADKLITKAKKGGLHAYRLIEPDLTIDAVKKLISSVAPRFEKRQGGYTRIIRTEKRLKDNTQEVILEWTEKAPIVDPKKEKSKKDAKGVKNAKEKKMDKKELAASLKSTEKKNKDKAKDNKKKAEEKSDKKEKKK